MTRVTLRPVRNADFAAWRALWHGFARFNGHDGEPPVEAEVTALRDLPQQAATVTLADLRTLDRARSQSELLRALLPLLGEHVVHHRRGGRAGWVCAGCEAEGRGGRLGPVVRTARIRSLGGAMNVRRIA